MSIEIEKGVPVPDPRTRIGNGNPKYPFRGLEIGDSFFVPLGGEPNERVFGRLRVAARDNGSRLKRVFAVREWTNADSVEGIRVWRTS